MICRCSKQGQTISMGQKGQYPPCNFLSPGNLPCLAPPGNFPISPPDHLSCILYMLSFHNHLEKIVDIYKSTKSRKVCHVRSISEIFLMHFFTFFFKIPDNRVKYNVNLRGQFEKILFSVLH